MCVRISTHKRAYTPHSAAPFRVAAAPLLCGFLPAPPFYWYSLLPVSPPHPSSEQGFLKLKATETYQMASEEWVKRFLRLAGHWPKDTREPRGPEHMAKMKAARGPYSDPRDTYIARTIRWAFERSKASPCRRVSW